MGNRNGFPPVKSAPLFAFKDMAYVQTTMERKVNWRQVYWPFDSREETYADHRLGFPQPQYPCIFNLLHLHLVPPLGVTHWNFIKFFGIEKLQCMDYHAASVAGSASHHFDRTPTCDGHTMTVYTALAFCHTVRMQPRCTSCNNTYIQQQSCIQARQNSMLIKISTNYQHVCNATSHQLCVTHSVVGISISGLNGLIRGDEHTTTSL